MYDVTVQRDYKEKYFKKLMPLGQKYAEVSKSFFCYRARARYVRRVLLFLASFVFLIERMQLFPWGGKITSESMKFFSPIVIWTTFSTSRDKHDDLYSAFVDYYKVQTRLLIFSTGESSFITGLNIALKLLAPAV